MTANTINSRKAKKKAASKLKPKTRPVLKVDAGFTYKDVHVVLLDFKASKIDLHAQRKALEHVLKGRYLFGITHLNVPKPKTGDATGPILRDLQLVRNEFGHRGNLIIFHYAGYGGIVNGQLRLAAGPENNAARLNFSQFHQAISFCGADVLMLMDLCYEGFGLEVQNIHLEKYMRSAKIVNEKTKLEILMFLNKSVDAMTGPDSFTSDLSTFLVEAAERKDYLDATRTRDCLTSDTQEGGEHKVLLMKSDRLTKSIPIRPSFSTLHRKIKRDFDDQLCELDTQECLVVVVDEDNQEVLRAGIIRADSCIATAKKASLQRINRFWELEIAQNFGIQYAGQTLNPGSTPCALMKLKKMIISADDFEDDRLFVFTTPSDYEETGMKWYDPNKVQRRCKYVFAEKKRKADDDGDDDKNAGPSRATKRHKGPFEDDTDDEEPPPATTPQNLRAIQQKWAEVRRVSTEAESSTAANTTNTFDEDISIKNTLEKTVDAPERVVGQMECGDSGVDVEALLEM